MRLINTIVSLLTNICGQKRLEKTILTNFGKHISILKFSMSFCFYHFIINFIMNRSRFDICFLLQFPVERHHICDEPLL